MNGVSQDRHTITHNGLFTLDDSVILGSASVLASLNDRHSSHGEPRALQFLSLRSRTVLAAFGISPWIRLLGRELSSSNTSEHERRVITFIKVEGLAHITNC